MSADICHASGCRTRQQHGSWSYSCQVPHCGLMRKHTDAGVWHASMLQLQGCTPVLVMQCVCCCCCRCWCVCCCCCSTDLTEQLEGGERHIWQLQDTTAHNTHSTLHARHRTVRRLVCTQVQPLACASASGRKLAACTQSCSNMRPSSATVDVAATTHCTIMATGQPPSYSKRCSQIRPQQMPSTANSPKHRHSSLAGGFAGSVDTAGRLACRSHCCCVIICPCWLLLLSWPLDLSS